MEAKILYTNEEADIQCVAVRCIEVLCGSHRGAARRTALASSAFSEALFLLPHESLYSYLYIGARDGTLVALRLHVVLADVPVTGGGAAPEHRVLLEAQSKVVLHARLHGGPAAAPERETRAGNLSGAPGTGGVHAIASPPSLPYIFVLAHGRLTVHEADTLQLVDSVYTAALQLEKEVAVLLLCAGEEQDAAVHGRRARPRAGAGAAEVVTSHDGADLAEVCHYALLREDWTVILAECSRTCARRRAFAGGATAAEGGVPGGPLQHLSDAPPRPGCTALSVPPRTSAMAWCRDRLLTGSPDCYCLYDTLHGTLVSRLDVASLLGGTAPYVAYLPSAVLDPTRAGHDLADKAAAVCSASADSSGDEDTSSSSRSNTDSDSSGDSDSDSDSGGRSWSVSDGETASGAPVKRTGWPSALVFRLRRRGPLHAVSVRGDRTDLAAAPPLTGALADVDVRDVFPSLPFLLLRRHHAGDAGGGGVGRLITGTSATATAESPEEALRQDRRHGWRQALSHRLPSAVGGATERGAEVDIFSCLDDSPWVAPSGESARFAGATLRGVCVFPLGILGVSPHMVEALLWRPLPAQLEDQIESGHYVRALRLVSQCFRGTDGARAVMLRRVCQASATRAMSRRRYRVAFYLYMLSDPVEGSVLRLFPELQLRPAVAEPHSDADGRPTTTTSTAMVQLTYDSSAPYRVLYRVLWSTFASLVAEAAHEDEPSGRGDAALAGRGRDRRAIEFAIFSLLVVDGGGVRRVGATREELLQFMARTRTLSPGDCTTAMQALATTPSPLLRALLMAASGDCEAALAECHRCGDVSSAGAVLEMLGGSHAVTAATLDELYLTHLAWMLETDAVATVQLLTAPSRTGHRRPTSAALLPVLLAAGGTVLLDYLSYLINAERSEDPVVHNVYAMHLVDTLHSLRSTWGLQGFASGELGAQDGAGSETGIVGHLRRALTSFLRCSPHYDKERVLATVTATGMLEEQCIVLEVLEDHVGALTVMVYAMKDLGRAVRYCEAHCAHDSAQWPPGAGGLSTGPWLPHWSGGGGEGAAATPPSSAQQAPATGTGTGTAPRTPSPTRMAAPRDRDRQRIVSSVATTVAQPASVAAALRAASAAAEWPSGVSINLYLHLLLHVLLVPPSPHAAAREEAMWLLRTHAACMDPGLVLASLPGDVGLPRIAPFLIRALQRLEVHHHVAQMEAAAARSALSDAVRWHVALQQRCVWVEGRRCCVVCGERLDDGGLVAVFPNLKPAHLRCYGDVAIDPERGVPFLTITL
ncbi:Vacuolar sorting protein 39 domain 2 [Novymonas esmeraldas]|uniref:Vacuolar sorting protein 39 domain 2 n=1 Tax=Novymonas esmeraldas TaxID=1808958 RepID=A0AAW0F449_9TRYP